MELSKLTYIVFELNSVLDSGAGDDIPIEEAKFHIGAGDTIPWLRERFQEIDLSLLSGDDISEYQAGLSDIEGAYEDSERRKWGVERRALCLLIAWTNELVQREHRQSS